MLTSIFGIWASEPPPGPGERLKRPGLIGLKIRAGVHKRFMLIKDTATGLIQSVNNHRIFHAPLTLSTLSNAISQGGQCPGPCHPVILTQTDI